MVGKGNTKVMVTRKNSKRAHPSKMRPKPLIIFGGGILLLILVFASFFPMTRKAEEEPYIVDLDRRLTAIEEHLASESGSGEQDGQGGGLGSQVERLNTSWQRLDASLTLKTNLLAERLDKLEARLEDLKKKLDRQPVASTGQPKPKSKPKPKTIVVKKKTPEPKPSPRYHIVKKGDTAYSISKAHGLTLQELKKLNNFNEKTTIYPGQKIAIKP